MLICRLRYSLFEQAMLGLIGGFIGRPLAFGLGLHILAPGLAADFWAAGAEQPAGAQSQ